MMNVKNGGELMDYSNVNTDRYIIRIDGTDMKLDDSSLLNFSIQPPPSNWMPDDPVKVEKAGRMMHRIYNQERKNEGIATLIQDAADSSEKSVSKSLKETIIGPELTIVKIGPDNRIALNDGPDYQPAGINAAKVDLRRWEKGDTVKIRTDKTKFGLYEMINTKRQNQSIDVIKIE
jgi:hypothetical protein